MQTLQGYRNDLVPHAPMTLDKLAHLLVRHSTRVRPGDLVRLAGPPESERLLVALHRDILRAGGHPLVRMLPESCDDLLLQEGNVEQLTYLNPLELEELAALDVVIHVQGAPPRSATCHFNSAKQTLHRQARQPLLDLFLRRTSEQSLRWVATQFPCLAAAEAAGLSLADYEPLVFQASLLHYPDPGAAWRSLSQRQARLVDYLSKARELRVVTPHGTDLWLGVAGRCWINGDGRENMPDGEVYTAPVEDATEGTIYFDFPAFHSGGAAHGVRLVFRAGRVVEASADRGGEFLNAMLDQDPGARVLGEVALGCNYALTRATRNVLLDEKIGGTFHLALGAAYPRTGGTNPSRLHWDLVGDLRLGGRIEADGQVISMNGRFRYPDWPQPENVT